MKVTLRTITQIFSICIAIAALACAIVGLMDYMAELTHRKQHYTEFPPEYDDYADWDAIAPDQD